MTSPQARKGANYERAVVVYLRRWWPHVERAYGAGRPDDRGDLDGVGFCAQIKNQKRHDLAGWLDEATVQAHGRPAVVVHKRRAKPDPADSYVTMTLETFAELASAAGW